MLVGIILFNLFNRQSLANGIGDGKTFNDKPTIVIAPDNIIYVAWEAVPQKGKLNSRYIYVRHWHNSG